MAGEIEFLDPEPAPGDDEQLPGPRHAGAGRRGRTAAVVAVVALVGGAFVVRLTTGGSPTAAPRPAVVTESAAPAPPPSSSAAPDPDQVPDDFGVYCDSIAVRVNAARGVRLLARPGRTPTVISEPGGNAPVNCTDVGRPTPCPEADDGQSACTSTSALPAAFAQAVRARLPGAKVSSATSQITRQTSLVWYRSVSLRAGDRSLTVVVEQPGISVGLTGSRDDGSHLITRAAFHGSRYNAIVVLTSPSGSSQQAALTTAEALAKDARVATAS